MSGSPHDGSDGSGGGRGRGLAGKTALVTGGSRGIGRAIALRLAREGAVVGVHYGRNAEAAGEVVAAIRGEGGRAFAVGAELGGREVAPAVHSLFEALDAGLRREVGEAGLDILVNNAGIAPPSGVEGVTEGVVDELLSVNVKAPLLIAQAALGRLRDGGRVINVSSAVVRIALPEITAYAMTKGALDMLTLNLAKLLGSRGITVNSLSPGVIDTDMNASWLGTPEGRSSAVAMSALGRVGTVEDIADIAAFLASDDSRWVTGQVIDGSGGSVLGP